MNILTLAGFVVMGLTLTLNRMGQTGKALSIGLMAAGTGLVFLGLYAGGWCRRGIARAEPYQCADRPMDDPSMPRRGLGFAWMASAFALTLASCVSPEEFRREDE